MEPIAAAVWNTEPEIIETSAAARRKPIIVQRVQARADDVKVSRAEPASG